MAIESRRKLPGTIGEENNNMIATSDDIDNKTDISIKPEEMQKTRASNTLDDFLNIKNQVKNPEHNIIMVDFDKMKNYPDHIFTPYTGQKRIDMIDSIREHGILSPIILREISDGKYYILSGHNRRDCGREAGLTSGPAVIKKDIDDEEARAYYIETNLNQRSFSEMLPSQKIEIVVHYRNSILSPERRDEIKKEIEIIENQNTNESELGEQFERTNTRATLAEKYEMSSTNMARYLRLEKLIIPLRYRLDSDEISLRAAVSLSFLKSNEQEWLEDMIFSDSYKIDMKKADLLQKYSKNGNLDSNTMKLILDGELLSKVRKKRTTTNLKISQNAYEKYFESNLSPKEIQQRTESALAFREIIGATLFSKYFSEDQNLREVNDKLSEALTLYFSENADQKEVTEKEEILVNEVEN